MSMTGFSCGLMCTWEGILVYVLILPVHWYNTKVLQGLLTWLPEVRGICVGTDAFLGPPD